MNPDALMAQFIALGASLNRPPRERRVSRSRLDERLQAQKKKVPMVNRPKATDFGKMTNHQRVVAGRTAKMNIPVQENQEKPPEGD